MVFNNESWKVTKGTMVVARGTKTRTLYVNSSCRSIMTVADDSVSSDLWHYRLGHMSEKEMKMLHSDGKLQGLKEVDHNLCEGCIFGKQKSVRSKAVEEPKMKKLQLVYTDIWGPSTVTSLRGSNYYVTCIDDSSRKA